MKHYFNPKDGNLNFEKPSDFKNKVKELPEKRHDDQQSVRRVKKS